jgi:hypothetical protein
MIEEIKVEKSRKPISKKLRFEIFKRDNFTCQYFGSKTPNVILEVDHVLPISKGGNNSIDNLITSCFDCNRGKGAIELFSIPLSLEEKISISKLKESQYKAYKQMLKQIDTRIELEINELEYIIGEIYYCHFSNKFRFSVKSFIEKIGFKETKAALEKSTRLNDCEDCLKYFCGICWNIIKNK